MKIAIVGAGISGLTTAFYVKRARPDWELTIFDAEPVPGGTMYTADVEGFRFEAGGNGFLSNKPDSQQLVEDAGADHLLLPSSDLARRRFIYKDGLHPLPESPPAFLKTKLIGWPAKLRVAMEPLVPRRKKTTPESLRQFGYRRLGKGFTDVFLDAMVAGIYATTPDKVSVEAAFPLVVALEREHGGLFRGMLARRKKQAGPGGILMSFRGGVSALIGHLHEVIDAEWRLGEPVTGVLRQGKQTSDGNRGSRYVLRTPSDTPEFDRVVIASPSYAAAEMVKDLDAGLGKRIGAIGYSPVAVVGLGYRQLDRELPGFGLLTTTSAKLPVLGVLWDSSIFPDRAPEGGRILRLIIGGQRNPELVDQDEQGLVRTALEGVRATMGLTDDPEVTYVKRWPRGIPSYAPGHIARVDAIFERLASHRGLYLNSNAYRGIAMNDCVRNGRLLAERIVGEGG
jgi:oxygen-dependent protoporphyrinogen oxidase